MSTAVVALLVATALAACGGDGGDVATPTTTRATSTTIDVTAAFVRSANAVCADTQAELVDLEASLQGVTDPGEVGQVLADRLIPAVERQIEALRTLDAPPALEDEFDAILAETESRLDLIRADPVANLLGAAEDPFGDLNDRLAAIGLTTCAGG